MRPSRMILPIVNNYMSVASRYIQSTASLGMTTKSPLIQKFTNIKGHKIVVMNNKTNKLT